MFISDEDRLARAASELRRGAPVALIDPAPQSGGPEAALAISAEMLTAAVLEHVRVIAAGPDAAEAPSLAITAQRAATLKARAYDGDLARVRLRSDADLGVIQAVANPALALERPMTGPHATLREGGATLHRRAVALCKRAQLLPAALVLPLTGADAARRLAAASDLVCVDRAFDAVLGPARWREASSARVPLTAHRDVRLRVFRRERWEDEHYALEIGKPDRAAPVLTRLHSACATGDVFGSLKCDCGPQLNAALAQIAAEGAGVLVYLLQEGRGIGLANKMRAYALQDQGFDTVEANHRLGFEDDERLLGDGGEILAAMGFTQARLMTNNPAKVDALAASGIEVVERRPLVMPGSEESARYLRVKAEKSGHLL